MTNTVLVTGGAGYIGSHVALALVDAGYSAVILDDLSTGLKTLLPSAAKFYQGDIADVNLLQRIFVEQKISAIMHFAAKLIVPESVANPGLYYHNNVGKFIGLLNAASAAKVPHIIFSSTAAVYGESTGKPLTENDTAQPINPYGQSKLMAEKILADVTEAQNMKYIALRYFNVAGADAAGRAGQATPNATHLIKVAAEVAAGRRAELQIFGTDYPTPDGTCLRDYIHVTDLAAAHMKALEYLQRGGESAVLNCGYGHGYSVRAVVNAVTAAAGHPVKTVDAPRRAGDPAMLVADSRKIRAVLGWQPAHDDLNNIVISALVWEKNFNSALEKIFLLSK